MYIYIYIKYIYISNIYIYIIIISSLKKQISLQQKHLQGGPPWAPNVARPDRFFLSEPIVQRLDNERLSDVPMKSPDLCWVESQWKPIKPMGFPYAFPGEITMGTPSLPSHCSNSSSGRRVMAPFATALLRPTGKMTREIPPLWGLDIS